MTQTIRATLEQHRACADGVATLATYVDLDAQAPGEATWAWWIAAWAGDPDLRNHAAWAVGRLAAPKAVGVVAGADLRGAALTCADLRGSDLTAADLTRADLRGANLRGAVLTRAVLAGSVLTGADLTGAYRAPNDLPIRGWVLVGRRLRREVAQ